MDKNYNILSTAELKSEIEKLTNEFNDAKNELVKNYKIMEDASKAYEEIRSIINKREGKVK